MGCGLVVGDGLGFVYVGEECFVDFVKNVGGRVVGLVYYDGNVVIFVCMDFWNKWYLFE